MDNSEGWIRFEQEKSENLDKMLSLALTNYGKQMDWFLHHRDTGIKHLGAILTVQVSITSITLSTQFVPAWLSISTLLFLGLLGLFLAVSAVRSAKSSYRASIEYAVLTTKTLWALNLTDSVSIPESQENLMNPPAEKDTTFYIERHINNHASSPENTTDKIVDNVLKSKRNTFYWAKLVLFTFTAAVIIVAIVGSTAILMKTSGAV